ncbi:hypothetical protein POV27_08100 [Aureisphaera galaxeae]|uniref:hypothetical protein n=1 Tax=Aureisphaera galaxeae TaxID=1538023 RepID=UPI00235028AE|nr:hypothetical protein [Aureisphaera galaxeae]MDC8004011.1 hypothetical protein [Aureisphaera galaxeae]
MEESPFSRVIPETPKTPGWMVVVEKLIAAFFAFISIAMAVVTLMALQRTFALDYDNETTLDKLRDFVDTYGFTTIILLLFGIAGVLLFLKRKWGWIAACTAVYVFLFWSLYNMARVYLIDSRLPSAYDGFMAVYFVIFGYIIYFLNRKTIRQRYSVTKTDYLHLLYYFLFFSALRFLIFLL